MQFRQIGDDLYSCVAPPGYETDPAVLAAIHEFDPGAIHFYRLQLWQTPWSLMPQLYVHHGLGRHFDCPRYLRLHFHVEMPPVHEEQDIPNFLDFILEDLDSPQVKFMGGPGPYIPWDWNVYYWCRQKYDEKILETWLRAVERRQAALEKFRYDWEQEMDYRRRQIEPWILRKLDTVSDADWKEALTLMWKRPAGYRRRGPKPFVDLGRSPRPGRTYGRVAPA